MPTESNRNFNTYLFKYTFCLFINIGIRLVFNVSVIRHVCWTLIGHVRLRPNMSVSDGSPMSHVEFSDQACRSPMGLL